MRAMSNQVGLGLTAANSLNGKQQEVQRCTALNMHGRLVVMATPFGLIMPNRCRRPRTVGSARDQPLAGRRAPDKLEHPGYDGGGEVELAFSTVISS